MLDRIKKLVEENKVKWVEPHATTAIEGYGLSTQLVLEGIIDAKSCTDATKPEYRKLETEILGEWYFVIVEVGDQVLFVVTVVYPTRKEAQVKPSRLRTRNRRAKPAPKKKAGRR